MTLYPAPPKGPGARVICCRSGGPSWLPAATPPPGSATWRVTTCAAAPAGEGCPPGDANCASASSDFTTATCNGTGAHLEQGLWELVLQALRYPRLWPDPVAPALICATPTVCCFRNTTWLPKPHSDPGNRLSQSSGEHHSPPRALGSVWRHFFGSHNWRGGAMGV